MQVGHGRVVQDEEVIQLLQIRDESVQEGARQINIQKRLRLHLQLSARLSKRVFVVHEVTNREGPRLDACLPLSEFCLEVLRPEVRHNGDGGERLLELHRRQQVSELGEGDRDDGAIAARDQQEAEERERARDRNHRRVRNAFGLWLVRQCGRGGGLRGNERCDGLGDIDDLENAEGVEDEVE